jgi:hypothetical protein
MITCQARLEDSSRDDHIRAMFKAYPIQTRAKQIMEWYKAHPGEWERRHPAEQRRGRR